MSLVRCTFVALAFLLSSALMEPDSASAVDIWHNSYTLPDGRYIPGHWRGDDDGLAWNDAGKREVRRTDRLPPHLWDHDNDKIPNSYDLDDDNDNVPDVFDNFPWNRNLH